MGAGSRFLSDRDGDRGQVVRPASWRLRGAAADMRSQRHRVASPGALGSDRLAFVARVRPDGEASILNDPDPPALRDIRRIKHRSDGRGTAGRSGLGCLWGSLTAVIHGRSPTATGMMATLAWSPGGDGRSPLSPDRAPNRDWEDASDIYAVSPDGGAATRLTRSQHSLSAPAWSPDGQTIACLGRNRRRPARRRTPDSGPCRPLVATRPCVTANLECLDRPATSSRTC